MGNLKKGLTQTDSRDVERWIMQLSKAALADLVIDLVRMAHPEGDDGEDLIASLERTAEPVLLVRGDRMPKRGRS